MTTRPHILALNETRLRIWHEAKAFLDRAESRSSGSRMSAEDQAQWERYNTDIDEIDSTIRAITDRETRENEAGAARQGLEYLFPGGGKLQTSEEAEADLIRRFFKGDPTVGTPDPENMSRRQLVIPVSKARKEMQLRREGASPHEARTLVWDTGSVGSLVPTLLASTLYQYLEANVAVLRMPVTMINTPGGQAMDFPRLSSTGHGIATQVIAQGTAIGGTDASFAKTTLNAFKFGELVQLGSEVVQDSGIDIINFVAKDTARGLGRYIGQQLVIGGGGANAINGVMTALSGGGAGSVTTGGTFITPTYEKLVDLCYTPVDAYRQGGNAAWLARDATYANIRKIRDNSIAGGTSGQVMWVPSPTQGLIGGQPDTLLGYPVFADPNVASLASNARIMAFGDWGSYYVRHVGDIAFERSDEYAFNTDLVTFRAKWRLDADLMDPAAIASMVQAV